MSVYYNDIDPYCCKVLRKQIHLGNLPEGHVDERDIREVRASDLVGYQHIHLFAGIGGFPLGFKWASFPDHISILTGGFPCQPHSLAGKRKASTDERDLWGELYRVICELKPTWIVAENVPGLLSSEAGRFFGRILGDLAQAGYNAEWQVLPAAAFGAPHLRERIFIVANTLSTRSTSTWNISTTSISNGEESRWLQSADRIGRSSQSDTSTGATPPRICRVFNGLSPRLDRYQWPAGPGEQQHEWEPPRVIIGRQSNRVPRLKTLGNAVVPQVAEYIGRCIMTNLTMESEAAS